MTPETTFILLFSIATAVAIVVRRFRAPYTVALVIVGLVIGALHVVDAPHLTKALLFAILLPGLLFDMAAKSGRAGTTMTVAARSAAMTAGLHPFGGVSTITMSATAAAREMCCASIASSAKAIVALPAKRSS